MRVLIGAVGHESNTFTPFLTTMADFFVRYGDDVLQGPMRRSGINGIIGVLEAHDVELVPTVFAGAMPGGVVERSAYETFKQAVLEQAHDVDGVCLYLHGAMRAEGLDYCENDLLGDLRAKLGPDVPITIALDMHANIVAEMAENVNAMVAYHTAPHTDALRKDNMTKRAVFGKCHRLFPRDCRVITLSRNGRSLIAQREHARATRRYSPVTAAMAPARSPGTTTSHHAHRARITPEHINSRSSVNQFDAGYQ